MATFLIKIALKASGQQFSARTHLAESKDALQLPADMYMKYGGGIPAFPHHEIEIVTPGLGRLEKFEMNVYFSTGKRRPFIFYPYSIPTEAHAYNVFAIWSVIGAAEINGNVDLAPLLTSTGFHPQAFLNTMRVQHYIRIIDGPEQRYTPPAV